jgi:hypothetical protein
MIHRDFKGICIVNEGRCEINSYSNDKPVITVKRIIVGFNDNCERLSKDPKLKQIIILSQGLFPSNIIKSVKSESPIHINFVSKLRKRY